MAHLELKPAGTRISNMTIDVQPNVPVTVGVWGPVPGLQLLPTLDNSQNPIGETLPANLCKVTTLPSSQSQFTFLQEGFFRLELRMDKSNWDWARVRCAKKAAATPVAKGSGTLNVEVLWVGSPSSTVLQHNITNSRMILEKHGFKLSVTPGAEVTSDRQLSFTGPVIVQPGQNLEDLAKVVVKRSEYTSGKLVLVMASARQHTDADKDNGGFRGIAVGPDYGVTGNQFILINSDAASADGMTLVHEMCHVAGFHDHNFEQHRNVMSYGPRRNELEAERVKQLDKAFFKTK
jgi:hypothetical protein